jgi:hypothetical protein
MSGTAWYAPTSGGTEYYACGPDNMRMWKKTPSGNEEVYFYGAQGEKLGRFYYGTGVFLNTSVGDPPDTIQRIGPAL